MSNFPEHVYKSVVPSELRPWRERRGRYRLEGTQCADCGAIDFPRRQACIKCNSLNLKPYEAARTGFVLSHYVNDIPSLPLTGYSDILPRVPAVVRLDDGIDVLAEIIEIAPEKVKPDMRVRMVVRKLRRAADGNWQYGYKFVPA